MITKIPVAVLAATGSVGQRFVSLLDGHPWFDLVEVTASDRSVGKTYEESCHWFLPDPMPASVKKMVLLPTEAEALHEAKIVFSALPADVAKIIEPDFAKAGFFLSSNANGFRNDRLVPILIPEINPDHIALIGRQQTEYGWKGGIITNPNCTTTGFSISFKAIDDRFNISKAIVFSMQALSGAGYPGVPSMDILDNVIPFISGEEAKLEFEIGKILGTLNGSGVLPHPIVVSAHTNRVAVSDAHTICASFKIEKDGTAEEIIQALVDFKAPAVCDGLPSCLEHPIIYHAEENRPQPKLDRCLGKGMATSVGRVRPDTILSYKMVIVSHNTIRGAAGGSILNGELIARSFFGM